MFKDHHILVAVAVAHLLCPPIVLLLCCHSAAIVLLYGCHCAASDSDTSITQCYRSTSTYHLHAGAFNMAPKGAQLLLKACEDNNIKKYIYIYIYFFLHQYYNVFSKLTNIWMTILFVTSIH